ncbi:MAG: cupin domain-containing protein [Wolinella sp.]
MQRGNLDTPYITNGELSSVLANSDGVKVVLIASSDNFLSDEFLQAEDEWVVLLEGSAILRIGSLETELRAGEWLFIPAHTPHQILSTSSSPQCKWLAVHFKPSSQESHYQSSFS